MINQLLFYQNDRHKAWRWRIRSEANGKIIAASSESFKNLKDCILNYAKMRNQPYTWSLRYAKGSNLSKLDIDALMRKVQ